VSRVRSTVPALLPMLCLLTMLGACNDPTVGANAGEATVSDADPGQGGLFSRETQDQDRNALRHYGIPVRVGNGLARTYVPVGKGNREQPIEVGVALSDRAMDGLPALPETIDAETTRGDHSSMNVQLLELPQNNTELDRRGVAGRDYPGANGTALCASGLLSACVPNRVRCSCA
jgi:hypothetical protein